MARRGKSRLRAAPPRRLRGPAERGAREVFGHRGEAGVCRRSTPLLVYEAVLPALPLTVGRIRGELDDALIMLEVEADRRADVALAVTEATTNVVLHAYGCAVSGPLYAAAALSGRSLTITVSDCGRGMHEDAATHGLGAGLSLIGRVADALRIAPEPVGPGTRVRMVFRHATPESPALAELLHDGVPARCDADLLHEYVEALHAGGAHGADALAMVDEARRALEHAKRLRRRGWVT